MLSIISDSLLIQTALCAMPSGGEEFKVPLPFTFRKKKVAKFQGLPHFKWDDLGTQDVIEQGSFGAVLRTKYSQNARESVDVVVKKLLSSSAGFVEAFAKEATLLSQLRHENIVQFKAVCQDPMAIMLEYVYFDIEVFGGEGKLSSLNELMYLIDSQDCNGIEGTFMDKIAADVAGGLLYLHENGIAHRDLKCVG